VAEELREVERPEFSITSLYKQNSSKEKEKLMSFPSEDWHYGIKIEKPAQEILNALRESLYEVNAIFFEKNNDYKLKCYYQHRDLSEISTTDDSGDAESYYKPTP